jgi:hypothetical protein
VEVLSVPEPAYLRPVGKDRSMQQHELSGPSRTKPERFFYGIAAVIDD